METTMNKWYREAKEYLSWRGRGVEVSCRAESFWAWGKALELGEILRLSGYRSPGEPGMEALLRSLAGVLTGGDLMAALVGYRGNWSVYLGGAPGLCRGVESTLPGVQVHPVTPDSQEPLFRDYPWGGCLAGLGPGEIRWDSLVRQLGDTDCAIALTCRRCGDELQRDQAGLKRIARSLDSFATRQIPLGVAGNKQRTIQDSALQAGADQARAQLSRLEQCSQTGGYLVCLWYGALSREHGDRVGKVLAAAVTCEEGAPQPQALKRTTFLYDGFYLPWRQRGNPECLPVLRNDLVTPLLGAELWSLLPLLRDSCPGFFTELPRRDEGSFHPFDITPHRPGGQPLTLGRVLGSGLVEQIGTGDVNQHVLITGASGVGKSTTLRTFQTELHRQGIPTLTLSPTKGDDFDCLPEFGVPVKIYSTGLGGIPLRFNPFIPEDMTRIGAHIQSIKTCICAASDNESPIPQALSLVMEEAYRRHGWSVSDLVLPGHGKSFPDFRELRDLVRPWLETCGLYQGEVRTNVGSALYVRLQALAGFDFLLGREKLPAAQLLTGNALVRFDALETLADKCFFGCALLVNLNEYIRTRGLTDQLRNVLILDEAHNLLLRPGSQSGSAQEVSSFIANLLSEVRGYGMGMILADQQPSILNPAAIANTAVKILHAMERQQDEEEVAGMLNLSDFQRSRFHSLGTGQAVVALRGQSQILQVQVDRPERVAASLTMCRYCGYSHLCCREEGARQAAALPLGALARELTCAMGDRAYLMEQMEQLLAEAGLEGALPPIRQCTLGHAVEKAFPQEIYRQFFDQFYSENMH